MRSLEAQWRGGVVTPNPPVARPLSEITAFTFPYNSEETACQ